jgi:hypothetical protein
MQRTLKESSKIQSAMRFFSTERRGLQDMGTGHGHWALGTGTGNWTRSGVAFWVGGVLETAAARVFLLRGRKLPWLGT